MGNDETVKRTGRYTDHSLREPAYLGARRRTTKSRRQPLSSGVLWILFGLALHLSWETQETRAAVDLVGSWSGETQFETNGFNYTPGAGTNRVALIVVAAESDGNPVANVNQVTLGGQTLTAIEDADGVVVGSGGSFHNVLWLGYLNESGISSMSGNTLSVTWDQTPNTPNGEIMVQAATYQDVDQLVPVAVSASNTNTSASSIQAGSVTPGTGDRLVYVALDGQPGNHTAPGGYTEQLEQDGPANDISCASVERDATTSSTENPTASWSVTSRQVIISVVLTEHVAIDLANGLVAFWKLNEGSGTNATDSSSNTNDGTLTNSPAWTDGAHGGAVDFDGVDDYIDVGSDASIDDMWAGGGTFAAWTFIEGAGETNFGRFADKASDVDATVGWAIQMNNGTTSIRLEAGFSTTRGIWNSGTNSVSANSWYHVAVVYDSDSAANDALIYINGVSQTVTNSTPPVGTYSTDAALSLRLGNFAGGTNRTFDGRVDDIRIYTRELSTGEIVRLANGSGRIGHWKFDDAAGGTATDSAGNNNGTLTGVPDWVTGIFCGALDFDDTNDYVDMGDVHDLGSTDDATITGWFNRDTFTTDDAIVAKRNGIGAAGDQGYIVYIDASADNLVFKADDATDLFSLTSTTTFTSTGWNHFAIVWDQDSAANCEIYINGVDDDATQSGTIGDVGSLANALAFRVGAESDAGSKFDGKLDDIRLFDRALAPWEIQNLAATYQVIDLGSTSGEKSLGLCVNDSEQVGGYDQTVAAGNSTAWFQQYCDFSTIATLTGGSVNEALAINNAGTVVGWSAATGGIFKAFSWTSGGGTTDLGLLSGRTDSEGLGVNSSNEVCGTALNIGPPPTSRLAFLYLPVAAYSLSMGMNSLGTLGGAQSLAVDINDSGEVVGGALDSTPTMKPFIWLPSAAYGFGAGMNSLGTLGGESKDIVHRAHAINASGQVVGRSYTAGGEGHAFHWQSGTMTDMGVLTAGTSSFALDINDSGIAVGTANVSGGTFHAFVWDGTTMSDLNDLIDSNSGWTLTRATGINTDGEIVGWGTNGSGNIRAFMLVQSCGASTSTTGSLASAVIGEGSGKTDANGEFEEVVLDAEGESLGEITILETTPDATVEFEVTEPNELVNGRLGPAPGTLEGFADGIALPRTLAVETSVTEGDFIAIVSMTFFASELDDSAVDPEEVELHVLDTDLGSPPGVWVPAGANIGESAPTGIVGDSGFEVYSDLTVSFWAVRGTVGIFAVGASVVAQDDETPAIDDDPDMADDPTPGGVPPVCGLGLVAFSLLALTMLVAIRTRKYGF